MTEPLSVRMRAILEAGYQRFHERLRRRLGSDALATEVLHETWLRIGRMPKPGVPFNWPVVAPRSHATVSS